MLKLEQRSLAYTSREDLARCEMWESQRIRQTHRWFQRFNIRWVDFEVHKDLDDEKINGLHECQCPAT